MKRKGRLTREERTLESDEVAAERRPQLRCGEVARGKKDESDFVSLRCFFSFSFFLQCFLFTFSLSLYPSLASAADFARSGDAILKGDNGAIF